MSSRPQPSYSRSVVISLGAVTLAAVTVAGVMAWRAHREAHRNAVAAQATLAWLEDMAEEQKELPRFIPKAREAIALQRTALGTDPAARAGALTTFALMSELSHWSFMGSDNTPDAVRGFEADIANELADIELQLLEQHDDRAIGLMLVFSEEDVCDRLPNGKCDRLLLLAAREVQSRMKAGNKNLKERANGLARGLNSRAWDVVKAAGQPADAYARAMEKAEAAAQIDPEAGIVHTLALAQYRASQIDLAAASIARAIALRQEHKPESIDLAVQALIDAKAGRSAAAETALSTIEARRAAAAAEAARKGQTAPLNAEVSSLIAEARAMPK